MTTPKTSQMEAGHSPACDCGSKHCNGKTQLNGLRFVCDGQCSILVPPRDFPVYDAAPSLLSACEGALEALQTYQTEDIAHLTIELTASLISKLQSAIGAAGGGKS